MKSALLILAAYQITASVDHPYMDRQTKEAVEKMESALCGSNPGYYGLIDAPIYSDNSKIRPHTCKLRLPENFGNGD